MNNKNILEIKNPYNGVAIGKLSYMTYDIVIEKLEKAHKIYQDMNSRMKLCEQINILEKLLGIFVENKLNIIRQAVQESGKPYIDTKIEFEKSVDSIKNAINYIFHQNEKQTTFSTVSKNDHHFAYTLREPKGVIFALCAFNFPINTVMRHIIAAIASNSPILIKPSTKTPLTCKKIIQLINTIIPKGWIDMLNIRTELTSKLLTDSRIGFFSFTGSSNVGWKLRKKLSEGIECSLEHSSISPAIICEDADIKSSIRSIIKSAFSYSGQACLSTQKLYVHKSIVDKVAKRLVKYTERLMIGNPQEESLRVEIGPIITKERLESIDKLVKKAIKGGAKLLTGGEVIFKTCYKPTILLDPPKDTDASNKGIFGPILSIYSYSDFDECILNINSLNYGIQATVFTQNIDKALQLSKKINFPSVIINDNAISAINSIRSKGKQKSGFGSITIPSMINNFTYEKIMVLKSSCV